MFDEPQLASLCLDTIDKSTTDAISAEGFTDIDIGKCARGRAVPPADGTAVSVGLTAGWAVTVKWHFVPNWVSLSLKSAALL